MRLRAQRAARAKPGDLERYLNDAPAVPPVPGDELPPDRWEVTLGFVNDVDRRTVRVRRFGEPSPLPRLPLIIGPVD